MRRWFKESLSKITPKIKNLKLYAERHFDNAANLKDSRSNAMRTNRISIFCTALLATMSLSVEAAPGEFDLTFGKGGVLDLSEASGKRIPAPTLNYPGTGGAIAFGQNGSVYVGGGFLRTSFAARVLANGTLDNGFSRGGVLLRTDFITSNVVTNIIQELSSGPLVTSDVFSESCFNICAGLPSPGRNVTLYSPSGELVTRSSNGAYEPHFDGSSAIFKDGSVVLVKWFSSAIEFKAGVTAFSSNQNRDPVFERNAQDAISNATKYMVRRDVQLLTRVDAQDRLVIVITGLTDLPYVAGGAQATAGIYASHVLRLNRNGTRDTSFGIDGAVNFDGAATFDKQTNTHLFPAAINFSAEGGVRIALSRSRNGSERGTARAGQIRLSDAGMLEHRFTDGAIVMFDTPIEGNLHAIEPLPDGATLVSGYTGNLLDPRSRVLVVARIASTVLDKNFGSSADGIVSLKSANLGLWDTTWIIKSSESDGSVFVLTNTGTKLIKLQGTPAPTLATARYDGLWWRSPAGSETGWGVNLSHQGDVLFATWFTYDLDGSPMWLVMPKGERTGDGKFSGLLYRTVGPTYTQPTFNSALVKTTEIGAATFDFCDPNNGLFTYRVNRTTQSKPITRQVFGELPLCTPKIVPSVLANYQGLWWNAPENSEPGWGINLTHQSDTLFATWFTYDATGKGMWLVMSNGLRATLPTTMLPTYTGTLYRASGPAFSAVPWRSSDVTLTPVGDAVFTFENANSARFNFSIGRDSQVKKLVRQVFALPTSDCR